jgi:hypothetical protein
VTEKLAAAENQDRPEFAGLLGVRAPEKWPPPLNDADSMQWAWSYAREHPGGEGFGMWYVVLPVGSGEGSGIGGGDGNRGDERDIGEQPRDRHVRLSGHAVRRRHRGDRLLRLRGTSGQGIRLRIGARLG